MEYIIIAILIILLFFTLGYFSKKKHYKELDRLEAWKMDIMNRPVLDELSKVKQLNMTGETEEMFERWRKEWDEIITQHMPKIEEFLFDGEEFADRFRFKKSKEVQKLIETKLVDIEKSIQKILDELNELVGSEEKNRAEIEELKETYRSLKKSLLAHRHHYSKAAGKLESMLEEVVQTLSEFDEATENGNYLKAREHLLLIKSLLNSVQEKMALIPELLLETQTAIPSQLDELKQGFAEMSAQGYQMGHIQFEKEMDRLEEELAIYRSHLEAGETTEAKKGISDIQESINDLYDLLEKEVLARQYIFQNEPVLHEDISILEFENEKLKTETSKVLQSYHLPENDLDFQRNMDKLVSQISKRFMLIQSKLDQDNQAHSILSDELKELEEHLQQVKQEQAVYTAKLHALRKDELEARDTVNGLKKRMSEISRLISKSNIPGLPSDYLSYVSGVKESLSDVEDKLEEIPLDMGSVRIYLEKAETSVEKLYDLSKDLVEHMVIAEKVIQYGNRYRSKHPAVAEGLRKAEDNFHNFHYQEALEQAAAVLERVEPGCLKRIELDLES
ncbi:septation ring formation regulator EzrA [Peribacillus deserti]|uniref:Septation ring formation regulator EzrA n=1 Tax=Peribacillus deserti TaxID=673318 RepID=A0A2N5MAY0_9BACI|nr:septation ring formation regulator EzrA [Peribacillus deserti]PLT31504.1 septation ring formation regulator EzrA [Peribacillus deserti]